MTNDVRPSDLARAESTDGRVVEGVVREVRNEPKGHQRVVIEPFDDSTLVDTAADRVEVAK